MMRVGVTLVLLFALASAKTLWMCNVPTTVPDTFRDEPTVLGHGFSNYNLVSFGDLVCKSGDVEGAAAVRNNLNAAQGQFSIGAERFTSGPGAWDKPLQYSAVVGHNVTWKSGALYLDGSGQFHAGPEEFFYVGGQFTSNTASELVARANGGNSGSLDAVFDDAQAYYGAVSNAFFNMPATVAAPIQYGGLTINCPSTVAQTIVVHATAAQMNTITYYTVNAGCHLDNTYIINIDATGASKLVFTGDNMPEAIPMGNILYNVIGATAINHHDMSGYGSLLAPYSTYTCPTGVWKGLVVVASVNGMNQINHPVCPDHPVPNVPSRCVTWETECAGLHFTVGSSAETDSFVEYNAVVFGDFTGNTGDVQGRVAAAGNVNLGNGFSIGAELSTLNDSPNVHQTCSLIAGGDLSWGSGSLHPDAAQFPHGGAPENACVHGAVTTAPADINDRVVSVDLSGAFSAAQTCYCGMSDTLAAKADNTQHTINWSGLFISCSNASADEYVISLTAAEFSQFTYTVLDNCNFQARWVINNRGTDDVTISGDSFPAVSNGVVYNFVGQKTVNLIATELHGSFLGCKATLNQPTGLIVGKVVAAKVAMMNQFNSIDTCYTVTDVKLTIVAAATAVSGSYTITVKGASTLRVGDNTTFGKIVAINGDVITVDRPLNQNVAAGVVVGTVKISSDSGRMNYPNQESTVSSASMVGVAAAAVVASALLI